MAEQVDGDLGALIAAMVTDVPLVPTAADEPPVPGSPLDLAFSMRTRSVVRTRD